MTQYLDLKRYMGMPVLASEHGKDVDQLIVYLHWLMLVLFAGWIIYFAYALIRFRKGRNPKADYTGVRNHASNYLEVAVALVEAVLLIGFAVPLWAKVADKFPPRDESTVIHVTARQFNWLARYPGADGQFGRNDPSLITAENPLGLDREDAAAQDDIVVLDSTIVVPVNKPVIADITSLDVIHSFAVKPLRITQDATPGLRIPTHFKPTREGKYQITCAQLCGNSHYFMKGEFHVVSEPEYAEWVASKAKASAEPVSYE